MTTNESCFTTHGEPTSLLSIHDQTMHHRPRTYDVHHWPSYDCDDAMSCQDRFSSTILLEGPGMQGTNEEVSPDTSRC